jgi:hypothetical protein
MCFFVFIRNQIFDFLILLIQNLFEKKNIFALNCLKCCEILQKIKMLTKKTPFVVKTK